MKPTEFRIGNYVYGGDNKIYVSDFLTIKMAINYDPIPLTEDWLKKFRFQKYYGGYNTYKTNKNYFMLRKIYYEKYDSWWCVSHHTEVEYVHELQNLYFAIFKKELTLK